jgi:hypothetical protein
MKFVIVVLAVVAIAFAAIAIRGGTRTDTGSGNPPPRDEDALSDWPGQPNFATLLNKLMSPFAPAFKLDSPDIKVSPGELDLRNIRGSSSRLKALTIRVAHVEITSGSGLFIHYECHPDDGHSCKQDTCICSRGTIFTSLQIGACPEWWRKRRLRIGACTPDDETAKIVIYGDPGQLTFAALGPIQARAIVH